MKPVDTSGEPKINRRKIQEVTNIVSHEVCNKFQFPQILLALSFQLVHMFFGNEVTAEYWDYVWLNEGFATYLEHRVADKVSNHTINLKLIAAEP